jgi:outer membrane protein assembly factor BamB
MNRTLLSLVGMVCIFSAAMGFAAQPEVKWVYEGLSNLYPSPLVAEMVPDSAGLETVIVDSEARRVRCIDARGVQLWEYAGHWKQRMTTPAALSQTARAGKATLAIGSRDGVVSCVDGATGVELWQREVGAIEWGAVLWVDLTGDGQDELLVPTKDAGVHALDSRGNPLWSYTGEEGGSPPHISCPIAAADVDGDGTPELFVADRFGPLCLTSEGKLRWKQAQDGSFESAVIVADADLDGQAEIYCPAGSDNALYSFDALTGDVRWAFPMQGGAGVYSGSSLAVGDIDLKGGEEIVVADSMGNVYCLGADGAIRWIYSTEMHGNAGAVLGDVDGDDAIEVLINSGDHYVYCLNGQGRLEWKFETGRRILYPPTIADVDQDGLTDILVCGSDHALRCLSLGGRYNPDSVPWPTRAFDTALTGSSFQMRRVEPVGPVVTKRDVFSFGGFELAKVTGPPESYPKGSDVYEKRRQHPRGWQAKTAAKNTWQRDADTVLEGEFSLRIAPADQPFAVITQPIVVDAELDMLSASIAAHTTTPKAQQAHLEWIGPTGVLRIDPLTLSSSEGVWHTYRLDEVRPPVGAQWFTLNCVTAPNANTPTYWDAGSIVGSFTQRPAIQVLVNQVGYEVGAPKLFTVQGNFIAADADFTILREDGSTAFSAPLDHQGRVTGLHDTDWGHEYWRGDFSTFNTPGNYRIQIELDGLTDTSWPFAIGEDLLAQRTTEAAYRFFYYQRCGMAIPGFHGACHLDDAISPDGKQLELFGGWHDAGDYNTYHNAPYVLGLATAYGVQESFFGDTDRDGNDRNDFLDEIIWGGEHTRRMIAPDGSAYGYISTGYGFWGPPELETDNIPGTGDERPIQKASVGSTTHTAGMARVARIVKDPAPWIEAAKRGLVYAIKNDERGPQQFSAAVDLYAVTQEDEYAKLAKELFPGINLEVFEAITLYDTLFGEDHSAVLRDALVEKADDMIALSNNPFGVYPRGGTPEQPDFFNTPADVYGWHVGTNSHLLRAAITAAKAYRYKPDPRYLTFIYDQFNWILGNNPYNISFMEGQGSAFPPTYHHRYAFADVERGAVPGSVCNGMTWGGVGEDRPYFDMSGTDIPGYASNECWLPHNTFYLNALVNLHLTK